MSIGEFLYKKRKEKKFSQKEIAELCGVSASYINALEEDSTDTHAEGVLYRLAKILDLEPDALIIARGHIPRWAEKYIIKNWTAIRRFIEVDAAASKNQ